MIGFIAGLVALILAVLGFTALAAPAALSTFSSVMAGFVLPLTFVTLAIYAWRHWRRAA